jgi:putative ABC transport system permease protein
LHLPADGILFGKKTPPEGSNTWDFADVTIVGVIGDLKNAGLAAPAKPEIVCLYAQNPAVNYGFKEIVNRTAVKPHSIEPAVRSQLRDLDADMPFAEVVTMDEMIADGTGGQRFTALLLSLFTAAGLALAIVGIYGVVSYLLAQRKQELAVRVALGAMPGAILWLVLQQGLEDGGSGCGDRLVRRVGIATAHRAVSVWDYTCGSRDLCARGYFPA